MVVNEATAGEEVKRLESMQQGIEKALDREEEAIWQMVPLAGSFMFHYVSRQEGALVPQLLEANERVGHTASRYATIKVRQWLAMAAVQAGHLRPGYEEGLTAPGPIEQMAGYALLKGEFAILFAQVYHPWNHLGGAPTSL